MPFARPSTWIAVLVLAVAGHSSGGEVIAAPASAAVIPERIVLSLTPSPATSIAVTWRTGQRVASPVVQIARATAEPKLAEGARLVSARTEEVALGAGATASGPGPSS